MPMMQASFADLGTPLSEVAFVVVDLETTGGNPKDCSITEIGAVKVRGGEVLGEFHTLVNPGEPIPAFISVLTGISNAMVASSPRIDSVLPAFLTFAAGSVLVAHNAGFDVGFLKRAATRTGHPWPGFPVIDTVRLARQLVTRDEAPNHKLASLARVFRAETTPDHRALHDARATVDVLHGLIARVGSLGVHSLEELSDYSATVSPAHRKKRHLADGLPHSPGVYLFKDEHGHVLYVGTSVDIRSRVLSYFTASEQRSRMAEMVHLATEVTPIVCATNLEAQVRELRLIAQNTPRYNRRSTRPDSAVWVKLTNERYPRLSVVRSVADDAADYIGPFPSRRGAQEAVAAVHEVVPLRQCTERLTARLRQTACMLAEVGRCGAPCTGYQSPQSYATVCDTVAAAFAGDARSLLAALAARMMELAAQERFEEAGTLRDRTAALARGLDRAQQFAPLARTPELVAARSSTAGGWEVACIRHGRLAGSVLTRRGADPMPAIAAMQASADVVLPPNAPATAALPEETDTILRWLHQPHVRVVHLDGEWSCPVGGGAGTFLTRGTTLPG
ncbi:MAG: DEDD exonuclease domain-containing protein [Nostocoides sp.]